MILPGHAKAAKKLAQLIKAALPATEDIDILRADLVNRVFEAFISYLSSTGGAARFRNDARKALVENVNAAFYRGYEDAGGDETEDEDERWVNAKLSEQLEFMGDAFAGLKDWRDGGEFTEADVQARADLWGGMLDGVYSEGKLRGGKNVMLRFEGDDGEESCADCQRLKGKRKSTRWVIENNMVPQPGNANFECQGYRCQHYWVNAKTGEQVTF